MAYPYRNSNTPRKEETRNQDSNPKELMQNASTQPQSEELQKALALIQKQDAALAKLTLQKSVLEEENAFLRGQLKVIEEIQISAADMEQAVRDHREIAELFQDDFARWSEEMGNEMLNLLYREERKALDAMWEEFSQSQEWRKKETERVGHQVDAMADILKRGVKRYGVVEKLFWISVACNLASAVLCAICAH